MKKNSINRESKIYLLLMLLIVCWGVSWPISKIALQYAPPIWFAALRLLLGTVTMFITVWGLRKLVLPNRSDMKIIIVIGILQIALFMLLINLGLEYVAAGRAAVLVYTTPIWVVPISIIFFKEPSTYKKWIGFILGIIGLLILFNPLTINWSNHHIMLGNLFLLAAALTWAISILCARYMNWCRTPLELISWQLLVGTIPVLLLAYCLDSKPEIHWNSALIMSLAYSGIISTALAYWLTVVVSKELSPVTTSLSLLTVPICGILASDIMLHEPITMGLVIAMVFTLSGVVCSIEFNKKQSKK